MSSILAVEDSTECFNLIKRSLGLTPVQWAKSLREATSVLQKTVFDLILLDVNLPDGDGYQLCSLLRTNDSLRKIPIIFLTAKNTISDKVLGFSLGAEDFITKPFDHLELRARVEAHLRRYLRDKEKADVVVAGDLEINKSTQRVSLFKDGVRSELELTSLEFRLLTFLSMVPGKIWPRDEILNSIWGENIHVYPRSVDTHISKLRKKLGTFSHYIQSSHGLGYTFEIPASGVKEEVLGLSRFSTPPNQTASHA